MAKRNVDELDEVNKRLENLNSTRDTIQAEIHELAARKSVLEAEREISRRIAGFSQTEKDALFQELRAQGVGSNEKVGAPGE